jgi:hypothetical protein
MTEVQINETAAIVDHAAKPEHGEEQEAPCECPTPR